MSGQGDGQDGRPGPASLSGSDLIGLGVAIAASLVVPLLVGLGADALLHSSPIGVVTGLAAGIAAACAAAVIQFRRYLR